MLICAGISLGAGEVGLEWRNTEAGLSPVLVDAEGGEKAVTWAPQAGSQEAFLQCRAFEALYEGTRGPGKTDALLMDFAQHCGPERRLPGGERWAGFGAEWRGILFRQTFPQLADVIAKSRKWFPLLFPGIRYNETRHEWAWPTGEILRFSFGKLESDYWDYHGHAFPWIGFEELTTWADPGFYRKMMSCCRSTVADIPRKIRATTNPYGPGHNWVKARFALPIPPGRVEGRLIVSPDEPERIVIHGHLDENKILLSADPGYRPRLVAAARNPAELAAWLHGNWDIVAGGMFDDVWDPRVHVIPNFQPPMSWRIDRSFDWGSSRPFSVGWWAESDGTDLRLPDGRRFRTVRGDLFRLREWYGWSGQPNEGQRLLASAIAQGIVERELKWGWYDRVKPGPADSAIYAAENGESIAVEMSKDVVVDGRTYPGVWWTRADKRPGSRKTGWELVRRYLAAARRPKEAALRELPGLFVCESCEHFRRTLPVLPRSEKDPDDVDTDAEDHIADEVRYRVRAAGQRTRSGLVVGLS